MTTEEPPRRRGRPPGSVSLTSEMEEQVLALVRGGASLRSAAVAAGIPVRTLQGWVSRGRSSDRSTPKLRKFARRIEQAQAEARVSAEVCLHKSQPGRWLHAGIAGTDDPNTDEGDDAIEPHRIRELAKDLRDALLYGDPTEVVPPCPNRRCRCMFHTERTPDDIAAIQDMLAKGSAP